MSGIGPPSQRISSTRSRLQLSTLVARQKTRHDIIESAVPVISRGRHRALSASLVQLIQGAKRRLRRKLYGLDVPLSKNIRQICQNLAEYLSNSPKFQSEFRTTSTQVVAIRDLPVPQRPTSTCAQEKRQQALRPSLRPKAAQARSPGVTQQPVGRRGRRRRRRRSLLDLSRRQVGGRIRPSVGRGTPSSVPPSRPHVDEDRSQQRCMARRT